MPRFVRKSVALAIHDAQLAEHGGGQGIRDETMLESALARPEQREAYGDPPPDLADLAAAYAYGISRNHPFVDGNKRTSLIVAETFLVMNGAELRASDAELVEVWLALAAGETDEAALAAWIRDHIKAIPASSR